jgi:hypothetical protein
VPMCDNWHLRPLPLLRSTVRLDTNQRIRELTLKQRTSRRQCQHRRHRKK